MADRYALINGGVVVNVAIWEANPPVNAVQLQPGQVVNPGDTYSGGVFTPAPETDQQRAARTAASLREQLAQAMTAVASAITDLQTVQAATFTNNTQRDQAIKTCARSAELALRGLRRLTRLSAGLLDSED